MKICKHYKNDSVWKKYFYETKTDRSEDHNNNVIVEIKEDNLQNNDKISKDLFLNSFLKSFTALKIEECFEKIRLKKKLPKNCLITIKEVLNIRKGIDCIHDIDFNEVSKLFNIHAQQHLENLVTEFNASDYFCPLCQKTLIKSSVNCEKCNRWFHIKCVKKAGSGPLVCCECIRKE
jgi:hypothetical protein